MFDPEDRITVYLPRPVRKKNKALEREFDEKLCVMCQAPPRCTRNNAFCMNKQCAMYGVAIDVELWFGVPAKDPIASWRKQFRVNPNSKYRIIPDE